MRKAPLAFGVLAILALGAYVALFRSSPGELSKPHQAVAGSSYIGDCRKCHAEKDVTKGCLSCHAEIAAQLGEGRGFHHSLLAGKKAECARCHSEHNGRDFALVNKVSWEGKDPKGFRHAHVEFRLTDKHASLSCADCHEKKAKPFALAAFPAQKRARTFLGLAQACSDCHADVHAGGLVKDCERCHDQKAWKPAPLFDHEKYFSLAAGHAKVSCRDCHALQAARTAEHMFGRTKGTRCADCHANPHRTEWKRTCESCHTDRAVPWSAADARTSAVHAPTGFRLLAPHERVACAKCHDPALPYAKRYASAKTGRPRGERDCESCHRDPHAGQFAAARPRCLDCHAPRSFVPSRFGLAEHARTSYPLAGRHARAACAACHIKDASGARRFAGVSRECASCHRDPHLGQFRAAGRTVCESCHRDTGSWKTLVFDHNAQARFKLDSAHRGVACRDCHPTVAVPGGRRVVQYKPIGIRCSDCHDFESK